MIFEKFDLDLYDDNVIVWNGANINVCNGADPGERCWKFFLKTHNQLLVLKYGNKPCACWIFADKTPPPRNDIYIHPGIGAGGAVHGHHCRR